MTTATPMSTTDHGPRRYSFFDYDLDVVQEALLNPHHSEYQDHFGFRIQVKTDDEYDEDTSDDEDDQDDSNDTTQLDTQPMVMPLQLDKETMATTTSPSSSSSSSTTSSSSADEEDYTDIDTAITTPTINKHSLMSISSVVSKEEYTIIKPINGCRRRSSTGSTTAMSKTYRRPRAMTCSVTQINALTNGLNSPSPYDTNKACNKSVERPSDIYRNRVGKRFSTLHQPNQSDSVQQLALKEEISNNLAQLKEISPDIYDWEFWSMVINHFDTVKQQQHTSLRDHVCVGMPPSLRGMIWQVLSKSRHNSDSIELEYNALLKRNSPHEKIIQRDLARTFPTHTFFRHCEEGGGQEMLFNVIKAYSLYDPQVGYCQGLPFVVGCLLLHMPDEAAFCVLINLMNDYGLRGHFTPKMELLHERMFQFDELLSVHLPQVHRHLEAQGVRPTMYASQWFMTLFAYRCPLDLVFRVLDMVFTEGTCIILNIALALMKKNQATLLSLEFEGLLGFLGSDIFDIYQNDSSGFVKDAFEFNIPSRDLAKLSKRYMVKAAQEAKIQGKEDHLRHENYELSQRAKKLEKSYQCLTQEHQELAKQVIESKMTMARASDDNQTLRHDIAQLEHIIQQTKQHTEATQQDAFDRLAYENAQLVQRNVQLEDHLAEVEMTLIEFKMKYAQSENEYEQMKKMLGQIKKISS